MDRRGFLKAVAATAIIGRAERLVANNVASKKSNTVWYPIDRRTYRTIGVHGQRRIMRMGIIYRVWTLKFWKVSPVASWQMRL